MISRLSVLTIAVAILGSGPIAQGQSGTSGRGVPPTGGSGPIAGFPPAGPNRPSMTGTGAISGVVTDGATHRPVPGALVYLGIQGHGPVGQMSRQVTDAKGRFVFVNLPASDAFFLNVSKAGYNDGHYGDTGPVTSGVASGLVKLADGQWFNAANIPIWHPGAIGGTIVNELGEAVVGVRVRVLARILVAGLPHLAAGAITTTDDRGRYRLPGLSPGTYVVIVPSVQASVPAATTPLEIEGVTPQTAARGASGDDSRRNNGALDLDPGHLLIVGNYATPPLDADGRLQAYPITFAPGAMSVAEAAVVELRNGESRGDIDVVLRPVPAVRVSGRVDGPRGSTAGLVLRLIAAGLDDLGEGSEVATALVGASGDFMFLNVPAGQYTLVASRSMLEYSYGPARALSSQEMPGTPGLVPGPGTFLGGVLSGPPGTRVAGKHSAGDQGLWGRLPVTVGADDVTGLSVPLRRAVSMRGRVAFDGDGDPPGPTVIIAEPSDGGATLGLQQSSTRPEAGGDDHFTIDGLLPGEYVLRIVGLSPRQAVKSVIVGGADYTTRRFDAAAGQDFNNVVITYTDRIAAIAGGVQGDPGVDRLMTVIAFPADRDQWTGYGFTPSRFRAVPVSNAGTYKIDNVPAGAYLLVAVDSAASRRWQDPAFLDAASKVAARVTLGWGETVSQDLRLRAIRQP